MENRVNSVIALRNAIDILQQILQPLSAMNDINWRDINDDATWDLLNKNPNHTILVETEITFRIDNTDNVEDSPLHGPWLESAHEKIKRIAFIV